MKSKSIITKIILFALIAVMLFGTLASSAYESYDTYTYSIDGEPLKSPAAYTPSSTAYDSASMGLLAGNHWRYDSDGDVALWLGDMTPAKLTDEDGRKVTFTSKGLSFFFDEETMTFSVADHAFVLNQCLQALTLVKSEISPDALEGAEFDWVRIQAADVIFDENGAIVLPEDK